MKTLQSRVSRVNSAGLPCPVLVISPRLLLLGGGGAVGGIGGNCDVRGRVAAAAEGRLVTLIYNFLSFHCFYFSVIHVIAV